MRYSALSVCHPFITKYFCGMSESSKSLLLVFLTIVSVSFSFTIVRSQSLCTGHLGSNIFETGDFGTGNKNIYPINPNLAPGFIYTTQVPPNNGQYILTNDMEQWSSNFPAWISIGDNSSDPEGYMMVVNANVNAGIFYEQVIENVCANTLYEFSADVINLIKTQITGHSLPDVSFLIDDIEVYTTGMIPQDEKWHTYGFTFVSGTGQNSVKLSLRNNSPGGAGNDLALDNISFRVCAPDLSAGISETGKICEDILSPVLTATIAADTGAIQWQMSLDSGIVWHDIPGAVERTYQVNELSTGIYYFRFIYANTPFNLFNPKCSSISDTVLVEVVPIVYSIHDTICEGMTHELNGTEYGYTGTYDQFFTAANGCDSIVRLELLVVEDPPITAEFGITRPSCIGADDGEIYLLSVSGTPPPFDFLINDSIIPYPGTLLTVSAGTYTALIVNQFGCFYEEDIIVPAGPVLDINTIEDQTIILGHSIQLTTTTNIPLLYSTWEPVMDLNCLTCLSPIATPFNQQTYVVTAETFKGCIDVDSVTISVDKDPVIYFPNIFSPNNDGLNDHFEVATDALNISSIDIAVVYDRWGGLVTEKMNLFNEGTVILWDGTLRNSPANPGSYVYIVKYTTADGVQRIKKGDVTLIR